MYDCNRINKDCFWEYNFSNTEIINIAKGNNEREKSFLFDKILLNSTEMLQDLEIFENNDLEYLITNYKVADFNFKYYFRRKNIAEVYFLDKELLIDELKWVS